MKKRKENNDFISDTGVVKKHNVADVLVIIGCSCMIGALIYFGIMSYIVG